MTELKVKVDEKPSLLLGVGMEVQDEDPLQNSKKKEIIEFREE